MPVPRLTVPAKGTSQAGSVRGMARRQKTKSPPLIAQDGPGADQDPA